MSKKSTIENFIERASAIHHCKYDYSKFQYANAKTASIIICPIHGEFLQKPDHHTRKDAIGCPRCVEVNKSVVMTKRCKESPKTTRPSLQKPEKFVKQVKEKFGDKFELDLSNFSGSTKGEISIKCPIHGWFVKNPRVFITSGHGCTECGMESKNNSKTKSYNDFVEKANNVHSSRYTYPEYNVVTYENRKSIIMVMCHKHGAFKKKAQNHLSGQGCFQCNTEKLIKEGLLLGGYNVELFSNNEAARDLKGILYYLSINNGEYYKVGITRNLKSRLKGIKCKANGEIQSVKVLYTYENTLENVFYLEQDVLKRFKKHRMALHHSTELFNKDISISKAFQKIFKGNSTMLLRA